MSNCKSLFGLEELLSPGPSVDMTGIVFRDGGVKYLASSFTREGPILCLGGGSFSSCNLSLVSGVLVRGIAFLACTVLSDPVVLRRLRGKGGSGCEATGGADTGLFGCCSIALYITRIRCLAPMMVLQVMA